MEPETPRELGDIEDSEPGRRAPERSPQVKKSLEQFLADFERQLQEHPDQPATSAQAALEGRAQGIWRTPVEGGERGARRLGRRPPWRPEPARPPAAAAPPAPEPYGPAGETDIGPIEPAGEDDVRPAGSSVEPEVEAAAELPDQPTIEAAPAAGATPEEQAGRRRHRRHRRHRRK
jgi:hypothetical protein